MVIPPELEQKILATPGVKVTHVMQLSLLPESGPSAVSFTLPWPPTVNTYWRSIIIKGRVRVLISARGREYRENVAAAVLTQGVQMVHGRLQVGLLCHPPDHRARDLDNLPKGLLDALKTSGVIKDDSLIDRLVITRGRVVECGLVHVVIAPGHRAFPRPRHQP